MTAQVRVVRLPDGAALVATAAAIGANSPRQTVTGGALVAARPPDGRGATARFVPGQRAVLDRSNERIKVTMSGGAARQPLSLRARTVLERRLERPALGHIPALNHGRQGIATYFLDATTDADTAVHDFAAPVTITLAYTPEQVTALGLAEADLTIFWLDESLNQWIPQPTVVDPIARTVTTVVTHFSAYQLGDGSKPSDAFIPSLQGWQVGMYTGGVSYSYPIEVPAGPAGVKPALDLSYSSSASDGAGGTRLKQQAACSMVFRLRPQRLFSADDLGGSGGGGLNNKGTLSYGYLSDQTVNEIQAIVDETGETLYVVGGATRRADYNDIDYMADDGATYEAYTHAWKNGRLPRANPQGSTKKPHVPFPLGSPSDLYKPIGAIEFKPFEKPIYYKPE